MSLLLSLALSTTYNNAELSVTNDGEKQHYSLCQSCEKIVLIPF